MTVVAAQNDPIIRNIQIVLDPDAPRDRYGAIADYFSVDMPQFSDWCDDLRGRASKVWPAEFRMIDEQEDFTAALGPADAAVVETFNVGEAELEGAPHLKLVQKFGVDLRNIDLAACERLGIAV